ncbi:MAG: helix-turn-helix transcriptional regulator [Geodermatophilaceae bacterium]|jgi:DNA-binding transcriptional ArsR family regulator|nr:helix-turn-helix transcriptional regulator [Geodermatophilaceae bacterium]
MLPFYAEVVPTESDLAVPAALMGEPARAAMLLALMDGRSRPAGELARLAGIRPSTASAHLLRLTDGGLIQVSASGRNRYYSLTCPEVARAVEALQALAPPLPVRSLRAARTGTALAFARTCYDHLAGELAVGLARTLVDRGVIAPLKSGAVGQLLQPEHELLDVLGVGAAPDFARRPAVRGCLDWTQRVPHLAGALGAQVLSGMTGRGWILAMTSSRAVQLTDEGRRALREAALLSDDLLVA